MHISKKWNDCSWTLLLSYQRTGLRRLPWLVLCCILHFDASVMPTFTCLIFYYYIPPQGAKTPVRSFLYAYVGFCNKTAGVKIWLHWKWWQSSSWFLHGQVWRLVPSLIGWSLSKIIRRQEGNNFDMVTARGILHGQFSLLLIYCQAFCLIKVWNQHWKTYTWNLLHFTRCSFPSNWRIFCRSYQGFSQVFFYCCFWFL